MNFFQRLSHRFFGTDYALMSFQYRAVVRRVRFLPNGTPYVYVHSHPTILLDEGKCGGDSPYWKWEAIT